MWSVSEGEWATPVIEGGVAADVTSLASVDLTTVQPDGANLACSCAIQPMSWNIVTDIAKNLIAPITPTSLQVLKNLPL